MFIIGGLLLVKLFQNRHPDIHANAFIAFFSFAVIIVLTLLGIVSYHSLSQLQPACPTVYLLLCLADIIIIAFIISLALKNLTH